MVTPDQREAPASVLDDVGAGRQPGRSAAIAAALTLDAMMRTHPAPERELLDAAARQELLVTCRFDLDDAGRAPATMLAAHVRALDPA